MTEPFLYSMAVHQKAAEIMPEADFVQRFPHPVFVLEPFDALDDTGFEALTGVKMTEVDYQVAEIKVRPGAHPYADRITIGRSSRNDVVIRYPPVSKLHGWIISQGDELRITDAGSSNGTSVYGRRLEEGEDVLLRPHADLRFGDLGAAFFTASAFYEHLRTLTSRRIKYRPDHPLYDSRY